MRQPGEPPLIRKDFKNGEYVFKKCEKWTVTWAVVDGMPWPIRVATNWQRITKEEYIRISEETERWACGEVNESR